jgi:catechol 2,3-dioxygenase-like lactoylglutathione lyase family enzyme
MAFHHVAIATRDLDATHRFYTEVMGFELVKVDAAPTAGGVGWARHAFYDTGNGECLAVWDIHDDPSIPADFDPSISRGLGLPSWTNHIAFAAADLDALDASQDRWRAHGFDVLRVDHGWCTSIYLDDPNGIAVEFCCTTAAFTTDDHENAARQIAAAQPVLDTSEPRAEVLEATPAPATA